MKPELLFQRLVICSTALFLGWLSTFLVLEQRLPDEVKGALSWHGYGAKLLVSPTIWWFLAFIRLLATVGLYSFSREARAVFAGLVIYNALTNLLGGINVATATGSFLGYLLTVSEGAVLMLAFTPPLCAKFVASRSEDPPPNLADGDRENNSGNSSTPTPSN